MIELPEYAKPDLILDDDNVLEFVTFKGEDTPYAVMWWHRSPKDGHTCFGSARWRRPADYFVGPLWDLVSLKPLTLSPSLHCLSCGAHGFIENDKWRSV